MSVTPQKCRVTILVKALPQPSKTHGETVCCAGVTAQGEWKRLFPIRFRHLKGDSSFKRWDWVSFHYARPTHDVRLESCRVHEESLKVVGKLPKSEQAGFLNPLVLPSISVAVERRQSLALIRPKNRVLFTSGNRRRKLRRSAKPSKRLPGKHRCSTRN
jgi:hypothetical protein